MSGGLHLNEKHLRLPKERNNICHRKKALGFRFFFNQLARSKLNGLPLFSRLCLITIAELAVSSTYNTDNLDEARGL